MRWRWRIVLGFFAFLSVEQVMLAVADWQLTRPAALAAYAAEADLREVSDEEARAMGGGGSFQSCAYKRSMFLYSGMICFGRTGNTLSEITMDCWPPHGLLNPFSGSYFRNPRTRSATWIVFKETVAIEELK